MGCPPNIRVTYGVQEDILELTEAMRVPPPPKWGWATHAHPQDKGQLHLIPTWDIHAHSFDPPCGCGAHLDDECGDRLIHHLAFDGREAYEAGTRKHH